MREFPSSPEVPHHRFRCKKSDVLEAFKARQMGLHMRFQLLRSSAVPLTAVDAVEMAEALREQRGLIRLLLEMKDVKNGERCRRILATTRESFLALIRKTDLNESIYRVISRDNAG